MVQADHTHSSLSVARWLQDFPDGRPRGCPPPQEVERLEPNSAAAPFDREMIFAFPPVAYFKPFFCIVVS